MPVQAGNVGWFSELELSPFATAAFTDSPFNGTQQVQQFDKEGWALHISLPPLKRTDFAAWWAFMLALRGRYGTFLAGDPLAKTPLGSWAGTPQVDGSQSAGPTSINLKGFTPSATGIIKPGDYFQIGQRLYCYIGQSSVNADGAGKCTIDMFPRLRADVTNGTSVASSNTVGTFRLAQNIWKATGMNNRTYALDFMAVEAI